MGLTAPAACVETYKTRGFIASYRVIVICSKFLANFHLSSEGMNYSCSMGRLGDKSMEREFCGLPYQSQEIRKERAPTVGKFSFGSDKTEKLCHNDCSGYSAERNGARLPGSE